MTYVGGAYYDGLCLQGHTPGSKTQACEGGEFVCGFSLSNISHDNSLVIIYAQAII